MSISHPTRPFAGAALAAMLAVAFTPLVPAAANPPHLRAVTGGIAVSLDFATLTAMPVHRGTRCLLQVEVVLELTGSVAGTAGGSTAATVDAPCDAATSTPPGTHSDVFRFRGEFHGTVSGSPATVRLGYAGVTRVGGDITGMVLLGGDAPVLASVRSTVGGSGSYRGTAVVPGS